MTKSETSLREIFDSSIELDHAGNLYYPFNKGQYNQFEQLYLTLRKNENRFYPDDIVKALPEVPRNHIHGKEWNIRKMSLKRLVSYLSEKRDLRKVLEVGCGNGWLASELARKLHTEVCGIDVNDIELQQASRLFTSNRLSFIYTDINGTMLPLRTFDAVILASSIQYFPSVDILIKRLIELLSTSGEIHIIDSPICFSTNEAVLRQSRSHSHFGNMSLPEMSDYYFYHAFADFQNMKYTLMFNPKSFSTYLSKKLFRRPLSPFPWIRISN